ncbi:MAG: bifunctional methylenetetrahydrofolate dehydrogenase/methenyltetrahydrofolate cyclohydrolase [Candidatus Magasanikbacteria bacterium]|nr:bifunctional methylenetetrahydrofolate dehydrogenase/methenyltetrahydrofolate cyclohydrolase [Candidatus Magasanikbacteria bacterium]
MNNIIDGKAIAKKINQKTATKVKELKKQGINTKLAVVLIGDDKPSKKYVKKKEQAAGSVGIEFELFHFDADISMEDIVKEIEKIQSDKTLSGLIVQIPLPDHLYTPRVLNAIKPELDVDCLTDANLGKLVKHTNYITPPTPAAVMNVLEEINFNVKGKEVIIIGTGALVGKPLAIMMINAGASVTTCNEFTKNIKEKCLRADVIATAVGKKDILSADMVSDGTIVIDTGIHFDENKIRGDVDFEEVKKKADYVTPTPGGIGPITVARLLLNTVMCAGRDVKGS